MQFPSPPRTIWYRASLRFSVGKLGFAIFLLLVACYLLPSFSRAHAATYNEPPAPPAQSGQYGNNVAPDVQRNLHTRAQIILFETMSAISCQLIGVDNVNPSASCLGVDTKTGKIGYIPHPTDKYGNPTIGGAVGGMNNMIAALYTPPVSSIDYFRHLANNFGLPKVNAQETLSQTLSQGGYGFAALGPIMGVYEITRNIAYLLFALALVIIGLAIMLRVKIDPRTVMSIQNQIPKIIIGLILITFSYAIAGLLVDMMWVTTYTSVNILTSAKKDVHEQGGVPIFDDTPTADNAPSEKQKVTLNLTTNPLGFVNAIIEFRTIIGNVGTAIGTLLADVTSDALNLGKWKVVPCTIKEDIPGVGAFPEAGGDLSGCAERILYGLFFAIATIIGGLIVTLALFIVLFRIWFSLIKAFALVVLATISAPLWIVAGLFPGSKTSFGGWMRQIIANLAVFPATVIMFLLAKIMIESFKVGNVFDRTVSPDVFIPPLVGNLNLAEGFGAILGFGIILLTPDLTNMLRDALKSPPSQYSGSFGRRLMAGNPLSAAPGLAAFGYTMANMKNVPVINRFFKGGGDKETPTAPP